MIKLKDLLKEVAWEKGTLEMVALRRIPISAPIMKKVLGDITVGSFHMTDWDNLDRIKSMVGKKKSLSTFTHMWKGGHLASGEGIKTEGGILFSLEGKLMASSFQDIMSTPDKTGRRWLVGGNFEGMFGLGYFGIEGHLDKNKTWKEKYRALSMGEIASLPGKDKAEYIKIYIDEVTKLMVKNKAKIKKEFGQKITKSPYGTTPHWNELIVSQIKLKDALIIKDSMSIEWLISSVNNEQVPPKYVVDKVKKVAGGKVIWGDKDDVPKFVKKRGGIVG